MACRAVGELAVSCSDGAVDLEVTEHALDAVALTVNLFAVADRCCSLESIQDSCVKLVLFTRPRLRLLV